MPIPPSHAVPRVACAMPRRQQPRYAAQQTKVPLLCRVSARYGSAMRARRSAEARSAQTIMQHMAMSRYRGQAMPRLLRCWRTPRHTRYTRDIADLKRPAIVTSTTVPIYRCLFIARRPAPVHRFSRPRPPARRPPGLSPAAATMLLSLFFFFRHVDSFSSHVFIAQLPNIASRIFSFARYDYFRHCFRQAA